ncbi:hypothetical protein JCM3774_004205 [Rhodotorula dairenensis]
MAPTRLPRDAIAAQLETVELAQSLFPGDDELVLDEETAAHLPTLRAWIEAGDAQQDDAESDLDELAFTVRLGLDQQDDLTSFSLALSIRLSLWSGEADDDPALALPDGTRAATIRASQPPWMSRTAHDELCTSWPPARLHSARLGSDCDTTTTTLTTTPAASFASNVDLLLATIDHIRSVTPALLPAPADPPAPTPRAAGRGKPDRDGADREEYRVWFYFPSLSSREKRDDMVNWAPEYNLTGFVLAGKPALLCVEGTESNVQAYLSDIKANSWADIPSFQKKVSERFRTRLLPPSTSPADPTAAPAAAAGATADPTLRRLFTSMDEITALIPRGGYRGHKPEMGDVRDFLAAKGLGDAFGQVVGGGQFA